MIKKMFMTLATVSSLALIAANAQTVVKIEKTTASKISVSTEISGPNAKAFKLSLERNLALSGVFAIERKGAVTVSGATGSGFSVKGAGLNLSVGSQAATDVDARMEARRLADSMVKSYANIEGFARDKIVFVNRKGSNNAELCVCYPDGGDAKQLTSDSKASVGPRWRDDATILYTGFLENAPRIYELDVNSGKRSRKWDFSGLNTGAVVSPDGTKVAAIFSFQRNPELYVIDLVSKTWQRMTQTPLASEGQPSWSPDGKEIVYVSDEARLPQLYVVNVATKAKRRLTSKGSQNLDPDWGNDGRIAYITKRQGLSYVAVIDPAKGESSSRLVSEGGTWEHPSWSRDCRHAVASRDKALFIVDTAEDNPDKPVQLTRMNGNLITPSWRK